MPIYTVHEPPAKRRESRRGPENFRFVRDGFHWWAFLLTPLWLLVKRLWLVLLAYLILSAALSFGLHRLGVPQNAVFLVEVLLSLLIGMEAGSLTRWTLRRNKWRDAGLVSADSLEAAERRFFDAFARGEAMPPTPSAPAGPAPATSASFAAPPMRRPAASDPGIVGLFPEPGTSR